jgi:23S rRNA (adenine2030-N6)-methyltransferase
MNYRHTYHAGGFADVFKHVIFLLVLEHMKKKASPFFVLDTHAGAGRYDLTSAEAARTGEFKNGIGRLLAEAEVPKELAPYLAAVRRLNARYGAEPRWYPGSPLLAKHMLRGGDRLALAELHPEEARALAREFGADDRIKVHHGDGYTAMKALLPPAEHRGVVLVDPPFEVEDEFERMTKSLRQAVRRFATGTYLLWYPIKEPDKVEGFLAALRGSGIKRILLAEIRLYPPGGPPGRSQDGERLEGCGLAMVNPPWTLAESLARIGPWLAKRLAREGDGGFRLEWLAAE